MLFSEISFGNRSTYRAFAGGESYAPYFFQWYKTDMDHPIVNATNSTLVLTNVQAGVDNGSYFVIVHDSSPCGPAMAGSNPLVLTVIPKPKLTLLPEVNGLTISWSPSGGTLQESATLQAIDWRNSSDQVNPQTRTGVSGNLFFRVVRP